MFRSEFTGGEAGSRIGGDDGVVGEGVVGEGVGDDCGHDEAEEGVEEDLAHEQDPVKVFELAQQRNLSDQPVELFAAFHCVPYLARDVLVTR
jgi:hypothetical protein